MGAAGVAAVTAARFSAHFFTAAPHDGPGLGLVGTGAGAIALAALAEAAGFWRPADLPLAYGLGGALALAGLLLLRRSSLGPNELVSNALKHAFPAGRAGEIVITLMPLAEGRAQLGVSDDGVGFAPSLEVQRSSSLGLQLVHSLVQQIDGVLRLEAGPGVCFVLEFPYQTAGR